MKNTCLLVAILCFHFSLKAQNDPLSYVTIASPNAASLGKYADIPISNHTGIPNIEIPIYTIENGPLNLPISINYHSGGHKVLESASWVGLGFSLNAGGVITRAIKGGADDRGLNASPTQYGYFHDYGYMSYLHEPGGQPCGSPPCPSGAPRHPDNMGIFNTVKDGEPDMYTFNFGNYSGKFYFRDDRTPILVPQQDIKIEPILADESVSTAYIFMTAFKITTPDGTKYYFGKNQESDGNIDAREITYNINSHSYTITNQGAVSSWFLNKIESFDNLFSIKLIYEADRASHYTISMFPVASTPNNIDPLNYFGTNVEYDLAKEFIDGVRLKEIVFANGKVTFGTGLTRQDVSDYQSMVMADVSNTQSKSLGSITVRSNTNEFCKTFKLYQSYFYDGTSPMNGQYAGTPGNPLSDRYHLRLDSIKEMSCDSSLKLPAHIFQYYSEKVPRKITFGQDHWGFYNGVTNNQTLIPTYWANHVENLGANRDAQWPAMRAGALQKIIYPTGGNTLFEYEANDTYGTVESYSYNITKSLGMGYDGNNTPVVSTLSLAVGYYKVEVSNTDQGSSAMIELKNSSNSIMGYAQAQLNETKSSIFYVPSAGTYELRLMKSTVFTGKGCSGGLFKETINTTTGNIVVGGLRIKSITTSDAITSVNKVKSFNYKIGTQSSGILYSRPIYISVLRNDMLKQIGHCTTAACDLGSSQYGCQNPDASPQQPYWKSGAGIQPLANSQGNHIGYGEVKVSEAGNGYSIYRYYGSNIWQSINQDVVTRHITTYTCNPFIPNFPAAPLPFEHKRGEIKFEGHFNEAGEALQQIDYTYEYEQDSIGTPGSIVSMTGYYWGTDYELFSYKKTKSQKVISQRDPITSQYISRTQVEYYQSKFHSQPNRRVTYLNSVDSLVTDLKYAMDYRVSICDSIRSGYLDYINSYNSVLANYSTNLNCASTPGGWNCRYLAYFQFVWDRRNARINFINHRKSKFTNPTNQFSTNHTAVKSNALSEFKPILQLQDDYRNPVIEISEWRNDKFLKASFTRYDYSTNPASIVYPNKLQLITLAVPSATFTASIPNSVNTNLIKDSRYIDENQYKFYEGNLVEITKKDGIINSYIWGLNNSAPVVKAVGVDHSTLLAAYNAVSGNLTTIRNQSSLNSALIYTYTYSPIIGMLSETNENKRITSYEYDLLGRLQTVKDHNANVLKTIDYKYQSNTNQ